MTGLLEREGELGELDARIERAAAGQGGLVVVEGPAGIGKSRLLAEARCHADGSLRVLAAQASVLEGDFPFGVARQLFEPLLRGADARARLLADAAASARPVFDVVGAGGDGGDVSFAALHGLYWLTVNVSGESPLLLAVDDLHWCDRPSLRFLAYLARRLEGMPALLVLGLRTGERPTDGLLVGELVDTPGAVVLRPGTLGDGSIAELVRARLGGEPDRAFTAACAAATGGNPLLLGQLLASLADDAVAPSAANVAAVREVGPAAVSRTVLRRLERLPADAAAVAQAVAVLGEGAELPHVAALAGLEEAAAAAATASLARADILRVEPPLGFVHPLVRDAVYHDVPAGERQLRHARAADLLTDAGAPAEQVATQLLGSPRRGEPEVVDTLVAAAESARARGAGESAAAYLARALDEPPPPERRTLVLLELGLAETLGSGPAAADHLREAWEALDDPRERARIAATLARTLVYAAPGRSEAVAFARRAGAEVPLELVDERQALRAFEVFAVPLGTGDEEAAPLLGDVRIDGTGPGAKMLAAATSLARALTGYPADDCVALAREALAGGALMDADPALLWSAAAWVLVLADRGEALTAWDDLRAHAHRHGSLLGFLSADLWSGGALLWRGDLAEAESRLLAALEEARAWGVLTSSGFYGPALAFAGAARVLRGDLHGARELLDSGELGRTRAGTSRLPLVSRVELLLAEGHFEEALDLADEIGDRRGAVVNPGWLPWRSQKARALDALGRTEVAIELASDEVADARRFGSPSVVGRSLRVLGSIERDAGLEHLTESVSLLERSTAKVELAAALVALGGVLRRGRAQTESREPLRRALELADRCGAAPLADQARAELYAAGGRPRRTALSGVDSLTASERRVVELAAAGRTNREIAQALFVTPKTVEVHLSNAYRKLGVRSRRELERALAATSLT